MKSPLPNKDEIDELIQFLPRLYSECFTPTKKWSGGVEKDGVITMTYPVYEQEVDEFIRVASKECWCDYQYVPEEAARMLENEQFIENASLSELKTMLTFCVRGERFRDGHMEAMIEKGKIRSILNRLIVIRESYA
jgi:hypothetical protein